MAVTDPVAINMFTRRESGMVSVGRTAEGVRHGDVESGRGTLAPVRLRRGTDRGLGDGVGFVLRKAEVAGGTCLCGVRCTELSERQGRR
jgi:hypothetical protein